MRRFGRLYDPRLAGQLVRPGNPVVYSDGIGETLRQYESRVDRPISSLLSLLSTQKTGAEPISRASKELPACHMDYAVVYETARGLYGKVCGLSDARETAGLVGIFDPDDGEFLE